MFDSSNYKLHNVGMETALANYIRQSYFGNINGVSNRQTAVFLKKTDQLPISTPSRDNRTTA